MTVATSSRPYGFDTDIEGRVLVGVDLDKDKTALRFRYADAPATYYGTFGDCCSTSWVEHLTVPDLGTGAVIFGVADANMEPASEVVDDPSDYDVIRVYHTVVRTSKGDVIIEYRNSSNGYYGGSLEEIKPGGYDFPLCWKEDK